ncbi:MAG: hypothetical protein ACYTF1_23760, partial [Planctomycetota bacterium]
RIIMHPLPIGMQTNLDQCCCFNPNEAIPFLGYKSDLYVNYNHRQGGQLDYRSLLNALRLLMIIPFLHKQ